MPGQHAFIFVSDSEAPDDDDDDPTWNPPASLLTGPVRDPARNPARNAARNPDRNPPAPAIGRRRRVLSPEARHVQMAARLLGPRFERDLRNQIKRDKVRNGMNPGEAGREAKTEAREKVRERLRLLLEAGNDDDDNNAMMGDLAMPQPVVDLAMPQPVGNAEPAPGGGDVHDDAMLGDAVANVVDNGALVELADVAHERALSGEEVALPGAAPVAEAMGQDAGGAANEPAPAAGSLPALLQLVQAQYKIDVEREVEVRRAALQAQHERDVEEEVEVRRTALQAQAEHEVDVRRAALQAQHQRDVERDVDVRRQELQAQYELDVEREVDVRRQALQEQHERDVERDVDVLRHGLQAQYGHQLESVCAPMRAQLQAQSEKLVRCLCSECGKVALLADKHVKCYHGHPVCGECLDRRLNLAIEDADDSPLHCKQCVVLDVHEPHPLSDVAIVSASTPEIYARYMAMIAQKKASHAFDAAIAASRDKECVVCMTNPAKMAFLPCGHFACCAECSARCQRCPLCREVVSLCVRVYT